MIQHISQRLELRRLRRWDGKQQSFVMHRHIGRSKYMPHIGARQRAKGVARASL